MPDEATDNGFPSTEEVDVDALFAALKEEIRRSGADPGAAGEPREADRRAARAEAERLWPVSADRPLRLRPGFRGGLGTPVKAVLRKLMRWYVEPLAYDQRSFNAAALRLVDDLEQRVAALEAELARLRARGSALGAADADRGPAAPGALRQRGRRDLHATSSSRSSARAGTRPTSSPCRSSGIRARACSRRPSSGGCSTSRRRTAARSTSSSATKFPSYVVRHREKRVWLVHQFRQAYELDGTELGQFGPSAEERALRRQVQELDRRSLGEAARLFATSANVAGRLERSTGLVAEVLPHPPQALPYRSGPSQGFVLSASRLDRAKRIDLLLEAAAQEPGFDVVIASDGPDRERLEEIARARGLDGRVRFEGRVDAERLAELYATCACVYYAPVDEDFGMGPYEAFLSGKPVITTTDAGGPLDVVSDRETGLVVRPDAAEIGRAAAWLARATRTRRRRSGSAGKALADEVTWDRAIARLFS